VTHLPTREYERKRAASIDNAFSVLLTHTVNEIAQQYAFHGGPNNSRYGG